jgi:hypothetical protein
MDPNANPPAVPQPGIGEAPIDPGASESHQYYTEKDFEGNAFQNRPPRSPADSMESVPFESWSHQLDQRHFVSIVSDGSAKNRKSPARSNLESISGFLCARLALISDNLLLITRNNRSIFENKRILLVSFL